MLEEEAPSLGAAVIAAVRVGDYADVEEAVRGMVRTGKQFRPNPDCREVYEAGYELYCELYRSTKHLFRRHRVDTL
jgi:ribulose kinase